MLKPVEQKQTKPKQTNGERDASRLAAIQQRRKMQSCRGQRWSNSQVTSLTLIIGNLGILAPGYEASRYKRHSQILGP